MAFSPIAVARCVFPRPGGAKTISYCDYIREIIAAFAIKMAKMLCVKQFGKIYVDSSGIFV